MTEVNICTKWFITCNYVGATFVNRLWVRSVGNGLDSQCYLSAHLKGQWNKYHRLFICTSYTFFVAIISKVKFRITETLYDTGVVSSTALSFKNTFTRLVH